MKIKKNLALVILFIALAALVYAFSAPKPVSEPVADVSGTAIMKGAGDRLPGSPPGPSSAPRKSAMPETLAEDGQYTSMEEVALYLHRFGKLPGNFISKQEARALGWSGGDLRPYAGDKTIGGDRFGNYEGLLPEKRGRVYYECDIDTLGRSSRGAKRIVFSNDGLIYYTPDHYESFTLLYGEGQDAGN